MSKIYIIGGVPRCGKSIIAKQLGRELDIPVVEGDAVRRGLRNALFGMPDIFATEINLQGTVKYHPIGIKNRTEHDFEFNGHENQLTLAALAGVINHYEANDQDVVIEGPMIEPAWAYSLKLDGHDILALFVGFLKTEYFNAIRDHAEGNKHDWINGLSNVQQEHYRTIWNEKSSRIATEASDNNQIFLDISRYAVFDQYVSQAVRTLIS